MSVRVQTLLHLEHYSVFNMVILIHEIAAVLEGDSICVRISFLVEVFPEIPSTVKLSGNLGHNYPLISFDQSWNINYSVILLTVINLYFGFS